MPRPKYVYRGKRKYRWLITLAAFIIAILVLGAVWLFSYMQRYIVFSQDGLKLVLPFMETAASDGLADDTIVTAPSVDAEIVVSEPDFSEVSIGAGEDIQPVYASYIPFSSVSAQTISYEAALLSGQSRNALCIQLKTADGYLAYKSALPITDSYGVNGAQDISEAVAAAHEQGVYMIAEISSLLDTAMASRNTPLALKNASGAVITDSYGSWLDPYNEDVRGYIAGLIAELQAMGFDEVVLSGCEFPTTNDYVMSQTMTETPSKTAAVSAFALRMSRAARELGLKCSSYADERLLRTGALTDGGQELSAMARIFDRCFVKTSDDVLYTDTQSLSAAFAGESRVVPVTSGVVTGTGSYCRAP